MRTQLARSAAAFMCLATAAGAQRNVVLPAADVRIVPRLQEVYRLSSDATPWATFADTNLVFGFDALGRLHILDERGPRILVVGANGKLLRQVGRRGQGPGEFEAPRGMAILRNGTIVVEEALTRAFILFDSAGQFVRNARVTNGEPPVRVVGAGAGVVGAVRVMRLDGRRVVRIGDEYVPATQVPVVRLAFGRTGASDSAATVARAWVAQDPPPLNQMASHAYGPRIFVAGRSDGSIVFADSTDYRVRVISPGGATSTIIRRNIVPRAVAAADRERARKARENQLITPDGRSRIAGASTASMSEAERRAAARGAVDRALESLTFADVMPVISDIAVDWQDRLWIWRSPSSDGKPGPVDVISANGDYAGSIDAAAFARPRAFGPDGLVAFMELDQDDVPVIVVKRLLPF